MFAVRVLFTATAGWGHVNPMVPLSLAFRDRGDEVVWATGPEACARLRSEGFQARTAGLELAASLEATERRFPELAELEPLERAGSMFVRMFANVRAPAMLADLLPLVRDWTPSLVIHDAAEFAAPIAAASAGVPSAAHSFGRLMPARVTASVGDEVAELWTQQALAAPPDAGIYGHLYLDIYPPSLQARNTDHVPAAQLLRPVPPPRREETLPEQVTRPSTLPLVYVTFGTVLATDASLLVTVVNSLRELPLRMVVTVGPDRDPAVVGEQPPNVHVARYLPQAEVIPLCAAVVSHAGSGVFLAALAHGLPQLCLPQFADQFLNAAACVRAGAGLALQPGEATARALRSATEELLSDPDVRRAAARLSDEIAQMPDAVEVAGILASRFT